MAEKKIVYTGIALTQCEESLWLFVLEKTIDHGVQAALGAADEAVYRLRTAGEPLAPQDIVAAAKELGFSRATVFRAREALGAQVRNTAGRRDPNNLWAWQDEDESVTA